MILLSLIWIKHYFWWQISVNSKLWMTTILNSHSCNYKLASHQQELLFIPQYSESTVGFYKLFRPLCLWVLLFFIETPVTDNSTTRSPGFLHAWTLAVVLFHITERGVGAGPPTGSNSLTSRRHGMRGLSLGIFQKLWLQIAKKKNLGLWVIECLARMPRGLKYLAKRGCF